MVAQNVDELREILLDPQRFAKLARLFIKKSSHMHATEANDPEFNQYLEVGLNLLLDENLKLVFELTESPIETIFVNSLLLGFIKNDPLNLVVQHSVRNAPRQMEAFRETRFKFREFMSWYENEYGTSIGVEDYLHRELERKKWRSASFIICGAIIYSTNSSL